MAENKGKAISIRAYAALLKVDEKTVRKARDAGLIKEGYDPETKKIFPEIADREWGYSQVIKPKAGVSKEKAAKKLFEKFDNNDKDDFSFDADEDENKWMDEEEIRTGTLVSEIKVTSSLTAQEAVRRKLIVELALDKKKLEEAEGILVRRDAVEKALFLLGNELKRALLDIPSRCIADVLASKNEVEGMKILNDELSHVLNIYGQLKQNSF
ncbi:hypothetical protein [Pinibacter soli]|uniref:Terminase small subunit n=1 Tax=Pinibacter soli TaxID=3044211 RepID=A0ABT6RDN5_9BACT|nr:hypothetical protein [Pinibacter soli]MDI3319979.1 hypothetical protein [Pinibacter soli]